MKPSDMQAVEKAIRDFHERVADADKVLSALDDIFDWSPECQLFQAVSALVGGYISALGAAYHIEGWLEWWWLECRLGQNPLEAAPAGGELRIVAAVDDLIALITEEIRNELRP